HVITCATSICPPFTHRFFIWSGTAPTAIHTLSLHDALPISIRRPERDPGGRGRSGVLAAARSAHQGARGGGVPRRRPAGGGRGRSEEHTSELQSRFDLVCRLLLEKKK